MVGVGGITCVCGGVNPGFSTYVTDDGVVIIVVASIGYVFAN